MSFASYPTVILNCSVFYLVEIGLFCTICILIFVNSPACMHYFVLELFSKDLRNFLFYFAEMYFDRGNFYDFTSLGEYSINDFYCFNFSFSLHGSCLVCGSLFCLLQWYWKPDWISWPDLKTSEPFNLVEVTSQVLPSKILGELFCQWWNWSLKRKHNNQWPGFTI